MAAISTSTDLVNITINGVALQVPKGELIVESVKRLGLEIPIFCYHPRMKPVGMCRMCLVEVGFPQSDGSIKKMPKPQAGCSLPASEGMAIFTDTEAIHKDRRGILEFLLINHPLDCPICDRGGECPLQNNTLFYGPATSRYIELKRHLPKAFPLSRHVMLDLERCIQCGRCVRFTEEISGDAALAFRFRGAMMQPSTFQLMDFESKFSGNVIEICPVGALTSASYRFRARPWDLETKPAICTICSNGCNIWFDHRVNQMVRINGRTNEAVNGEWTCDRGKFGHEYYNDSNRLKQVWIRNGDRFEVSTWAQAYEAIATAFGVGGRQVGGICAPEISNEGLFLFQRLFRASFGSNNVDHRWTKAQSAAADRIIAKPGVEEVQTSLPEIDRARNILIFGTSLADEEPILFLRVRRAWLQGGANVFVVHHHPTDADAFATSVLRHAPGKQHAFAQALLSGATGGDLASTAAQADLTQEQILAAVEALRNGGVIVTTSGLLDADDGNATLQALSELANATGAQFNCYARYCNEQGARELGILPDCGPGRRPLEGEAGQSTADMLRSAAQGDVRALWIVQADLLNLYPDRALVEAALERCDFVVYQGTNECDTMAYASVVLPMAAPAEDQGTYTNLERRVQRMDAAIRGPGDCKPAWRIFMEAALRAGATRPFFNPAEVLELIASEVPAFAHIGYSSLGAEGDLLARQA
jgi:NADH-quinone oxidoreductase subunit G